MLVTRVTKITPQTTDPICGLGHTIEPSVKFGYSYIDGGDKVRWTPVVRRAVRIATFVQFDLDPDSICLLNQEIRL